MAQHPEHTAHPAAHARQRPAGPTGARGLRSLSLGPECAQRAPHARFLAPHTRRWGPAVAEAERTEDALRQLRGEGAVEVLHALSEHGPLPYGELRKASGLATGTLHYRLQQLQEDQLLTRTGPSFRAAYGLTPAAQALGPIYAELAAFGR